MWIASASGAAPGGLSSADIQTGLGLIAILAILPVVLRRRSKGRKAESPRSRTNWHEGIGATARSLCLVLAGFYSLIAVFVYAANPTIGLAIVVGVGVSMFLLSFAAIMATIAATMYVTYRGRTEKQE